MTGTQSTVTRAPADAVRRKAPRLVLGLGQSPLSDAVTSHFRALGWHVDHAGTGCEAGRTAHRSKPAAVVIAADAPGESAYLTCAKVRLTRPGCRVVLVGREDARSAARARHAGAVGYLPDTAGPAAVARAVLGT